MITAKLLAVYDNQKKIGTCDECGASIRYEYVTDKGIFGSECVHKFIHSPEWITLKGKRDAELFELRQHRINTLFEWYTTNNIRCYYFEYKDGSGKFEHYNGNIDTEVAPIVLEKMIQAGYKKIFQQDLGFRKLYLVEK